MFAFHVQEIGGVGRVCNRLIRLFLDTYGCDSFVQHVHPIDRETQDRELKVVS